MSHFLYLITLSILLLTCSNNLLGQKSLELSLDQAVEKGLENNLTLKQSKSDITIAEKKIWEITAQTLPQVNLTGQFTNNIKLPVTVVPSTFLNPQSGTNNDLIPFRFGTTYNTRADISATQTIFNGLLLKAISSTKLYKKQVGLMHEKSKNEIEAQIKISYAGLVTIKEQIRLLKENKKIIKNLNNQLKNLYKSGLLEETEYLQSNLDLKKIDLLYENIINQSKISESNLKILLGLTLSDSIKLTSTFENLTNYFSERPDSAIPNLIETNSYKLLKLSTEGKKILWDAEKTKYLPMVSLFYNYNLNSYENDIKFKSFYTAQALGVKMSLPLFNSGLNRAKVSQAKLEFQKSLLKMQEEKQNLTNQERNLNYNFINALNNFKRKKESLDLSEKIFNNNLTKKELGVISSIEFSQYNAQYINMQQEFLQSALDMIIKKINLQTLTEKN